MKTTVAKTPMEIGNETDKGEEEGERAEGVGEVTSVVSHRTELTAKTMRSEKSTGATAESDEGGEME